MGNMCEPECWYIICLYLRPILRRLDSMANITTGKKTKFKIQRRLGVELPGLGKPGALDRRPYGPGQHGMRRKKVSEYAIRLMEKQKLRFHYGLREQQLKRMVRKAKKAKRGGRAWADMLIVSLESRLDNVIFRLNWAPSIAAARQMVVHGHIRVNQRKLNRPSAAVRVGDEISLTDKGAGSENYRQAQVRPRLQEIPACLRIEKDNEKPKATIVAEAAPQDIPFPLDTQLVTEFYWNLK